jgi:hypothetical protein
VVEHLVYRVFGRFSRPPDSRGFTRENEGADRKSSCLKYGAIQHVQYEIEYEIWSRWRNWRSAIGSRVVKWRAMHRRESKSPIHGYAPNGVFTAGTFAVGMNSGVSPQEACSARHDSTQFAARS